MVKFLAHGTGSAAAAAAYLLREGHHEKEPDPDQAPEEITGGATSPGAPGPVLCVASLVPRRFRMAFAAGPIWCFAARVSAPTGQPAPVRLTL